MVLYSMVLPDLWKMTSRYGNNTTSIVTLPAKIVGQDKPVVVRHAFIKAIGAVKLADC